MRIGLIAADSKRFNLALGKIAAFHLEQGDSVEWAHPMEHYHRVYISKIFNFTPDFGYVLDADEIVKGGTGYDIASRLPADMEMLQPDYSLYPAVDSRTSYGFLTRGCPNKCKWCVVPRKEGNVRPYMDIDAITQDGKRPYAVLMDNNILASDYGLSQIEKIADKGYRVDFNQALDARLVTADIASLLARTKWINSIIRFGCDTPRQIEYCERAIAMITASGYSGQFILYTMINDDFDESFHRINYWRGCAKVRLTAQPYRDPDNPNDIPPWQSDLARWTNRRELYTSCQFQDFQPRKGFYCKEYFYQS